MSNESAFDGLLDKLEELGNQEKNRHEFTFSTSLHDAVKVKALAEVYNLSEEKILEHLLHTAIKAAETQMPYVQSSEVIRVEDGEEIYADAGKTPKYVEAEQRIYKEMTENS